MSGQSVVDQKLNKTDAIKALSKPVNKLQGNITQPISRTLKKAESQ